MKNETIILRNKNFIYIAIGTALILLIPLLAMQFTNQVNWTLTDFITAGILLFTTGTVFELLSRKFPKNRLVIGFIVLAVFLYLWSELAVGIFTNWGS